MRRIYAASILVALATSLVAQEATPSQLLGFTPQSAQTERDWEQKVKAIPDPQRMRAAMERLAAHPHHVGSPYDKENAEWILSQYKDWGWDAHIETFQVLFPTPKLRVLEMVGADQVHGQTAGAGVSQSIPRRIRKTSSCRLTTPTRPTAMSLRRSST